MNREMLKLRKDPSIPSSAATSNIAPSQSPRLGLNADNRDPRRHQRTSPKGSRSSSVVPTSAVAGSNSILTSTAASIAPSTLVAAMNASAANLAGFGSGQGTNTPVNTTLANSGQGSGYTGSVSSVLGLISAAGNSGASTGIGSGETGQYSQNVLMSPALGTGSLRNLRGSQRGPSAFRFDTSGTLWALSASPDFSMVAVVGRDVLKILSVTDSGAEEFVNLKTVTGGRNTFAGSTDVKWGPTSGRDAKIATLGTNGPIVIWDVGTNNKFDRTIKEHTRAVNRICFSPQEPNLLLSASQDGTVRLWDLRTKERPGIVMEAKSDNVREVQFNPTSLTDVVAGYESGNLQRWDLRNASTCEKKFMAHMGFVTSLDFHPSGRFLASGGRDKTIKVWDMEDEKRREIHTIPTIQYTTKVQWRPNKAYHIAACFKDEATVQIFDVRRPYVPLHMLAQHDKDTTAILWRDSDVIWTVSKDKTFASTQLRGLVSASDVLAGGNAAMNCYGQLAFTVGSKGSLETFERDLVLKPTRPNARPVTLDGSPEATIYRTRQSGGVFECDLFNYEAFIYCAQNYTIEAGKVREACEHNSNIAWQANKYRDSQTWTAIKLFYNEMNDSAVIASQAAADVASSDPTLIANGNDDKDPKNDSGEDSDVSDVPVTRPAVPSLFAIKVSDAPVRRDWSHLNTIRNLLEYYAEQGDVQMCVTILLVLADETDLPNFSRSQQWFASYIDLLSRFKLWSIATAVAQACQDPGIHGMNQDSTTVHTSCSSCMKPILARAPTSTGFWACDRCRKVLSSCSVCHKTVRGIFTWCTQCSHGFHLQHAQEWFSQSAECPTGCGHQCFPEMFKHQQEQEQLLRQLHQQHSQHLSEEDHLVHHDRSQTLQGAVTMELPMFASHPSQPSLEAMDSRLVQSTG
ncbi:WD repeat-containing protein 24 [Lunasporangiospora selenospora]|uniref:WD repeat-containing protein 24 n=1 Tax=Lunasporangiospora selenospora TaxID=979761 RepID=A0A9P6FUC2_9FUNG|nr:WD repeat-containing protein 24 [Lunasporangiospora selenospora]